MLTDKQRIEEMHRRVSQNSQPQVVATIGAGDIDRLVPTLTRILQ